VSAMRTSQLQFHTRREAPQDAEARSHQLLVRGNYIRRLSSGIYHFMPLGYRVLTKVKAVIAEEFAEIGSSEVLLPALHPAELWEATGRRAVMDDVLFAIESKSGSFVLGPTHEEAAIHALAPDLASWRDLPASVFQIQTKFRDEPRARFGLMRTREFIMADGYTFDRDREAMRKSYANFREAYAKIFSRLCLNALAVEADSGAIGGDVNHEFMVPSVIGEDHFAECADCGYRANTEAATRGRREPATGGQRGLKEYVTPGAPGVTQAVKALVDQGEDVTQGSMLKCLVAKDSDGNTLVYAIPGDRELKLPAGVSLVSEDFFESHPGFVKGYIGPVGTAERGARLIVDPLVLEREWWASGANKADTHLVGLVPGRDFSPDEVTDLVWVIDGDDCPRCGGTLRLIRSVEIGHTFQLGTVYTARLNYARFTDSEGAQMPYWMGCYGIGVTRLLAVIAEQFSSQDQGLVWPVSVAPFAVSVIGVGGSSSKEVFDEVNTLSQLLDAAGIEVLQEDRGESSGVIFNDMELIGSPVWCVVGRRSLQEQMIEVRDRMNGVTELVPVPEVVGYVAQLLERLSQIIR